MQNAPKVLIKEFKGFGDIAHQDGDSLYKTLCGIVINSEESIQSSNNVEVGQPIANIHHHGKWIERKI